ncbi:type II toxin-antitoxin system Phd/YefM family antitoxin [Turneriella parva]|uniref:Antitoxin n=1 Tax=Turneriella parva (strain ATCC BAA-1111 / DSM 21527 / NCTC 11395 / H) TaxID=869212 RepID=I4B5F1_TURPD|nr:type II toxin-antitoxin system prevent-host-death family antitoxin [Turneriella parva]AFM12508.1 prevent-host-death family protein [Turneriella parva DSM 21527]
MRIAPMQELKENLATLADIAARGETIEITKHNKPFIRLTPATALGLHIGRSVGKARLKAAVVKNTGGAYLKILAADRE